MAISPVGMVFNPYENDVKVNYQPIFPLKYDEVYGPYRPITSEIASLQQNFENLLATNPGEWPMNPDLGIGLRNYLFESYESTKLDELKPTVVRQLEKYLPQVRLLGISFLSNEQQKDENFLKIAFRYSIYGTTFVDLVTKIINNKSPHRFSGDIGFQHTSVMEDINKFLGSNKFLTTGISREN